MRVGFKSNHFILIRRGSHTQRKKKDGHVGQEYSYASASQRMLRVADNHRKLEEARKDFP